MVRIITMKGEKIKGRFRSLVEDTLFIFDKKSSLSGTMINPDKVLFYKIARLSLCRDVSTAEFLIRTSLRMGVLGAMSGFPVSRVGDEVMFVAQPSPPTGEVMMKLGFF
jgi:hypothetical protein